MRDKPIGLDDRELVAGLTDGWAVQVASIDYLPVGAGSYHWAVSTRSGAVWFVTADDLGVDEAAREDAFDQLQRSLARYRAGPPP